MGPTKGNVLLQLFGIDASIVDAAAERNEWKFDIGRQAPTFRLFPEAESRAQKTGLLSSATFGTFGTSS